MADAAPKPQTQGGAAVALVLAVVGALVLVVINLKANVASMAPLFAAAPGTDPAEQMGAAMGGVAGTVIGSTLFCAGIPWAVLYFAWLRGHAPRRAVPYLIILVSVVLIVELGAARLAYIASRNQQNNAAMTDFRSVLLAVQREGTAAKIDTAPVTGGDAGIAEALGKQLWASLAADHNNYIAELTKLGVVDMLKPGGLATGDLAKTSRTIEQARAVETKYQALEEGRFTNFPVQVQQSAMSAAAKQQFVASFQKVDPAAKAQRDQVWACETATLDDMARIVTLLRQSPGAWSISGGTLTFSNLDVLTRYNSIIADLQNNAEKEKAVQQQGLDEAASGLPAQSSQ